MHLRFTQSFEHDYEKLIKHDIALQKKIAKQLFTLQQNPNHPSLRLHKLISSPDWSISVNKSIRIRITFKQNEVILFHIGKHEDVYN